MDRVVEPVRKERRASGSQGWQVSAARVWAGPRGKSGGRSPAGVWDYYAVL